MCPPDDKKFFKDLNYFQPFGSMVRRGDIMPVYVVYDQEPLSDYALDTYKHRLRWVTRKHLHPIVNQAEFGEIFGCWLFSGTVPICFHSEKNSNEISSLEKHLTIPCYYWYHAFVARDWFRYWERHYHLAPKNKSDAPYRFLLYAREHTGTRAYRQTLVEKLQKHKDTILYDWQGTKAVPATHSAYIDTDDANQSGIHLVAETLFSTNKIQLTEKVFKPMVMSQPFIIWGAPGTLAYLRDYGFQTFDHVWPEVYDLEQDHDRRMQMLVDLVNKIASLSSDQYRKLYQKCLPIIEHNRKRFFSSDFMNHCWQELETNWQHAIETRNNLEIDLPGGQFLHILYRNQELAALPFYQSQIENFLDKMDETGRKRALLKYPEFNDL